MLVQVYRETPMLGASILPATISMISVHALAVNTIAYGFNATSRSSKVFRSSVWVLSNGRGPLYNKA